MIAQCLAMLGSRTLLIAIMALASTVLPGCVGYQIGVDSMYLPGIRTVHVPVFESNTYRRFQGEMLTEAVIKEIESNTPYKVVDAASADSVLTGRIVSMQKRILVESPLDEARELEASFVVQVSWTDRRGQPLAATATIPASLFDVSLNQPASFVPESGQSVATAQQEAVRQLARQIVGQMNAPW